MTQNTINFSLGSTGKEKNRRRFPSRLRHTLLIDTNVSYVTLRDIITQMKELDKITRFASNWLPEKATTFTSDVSHVNVVACLAAYLKISHRGTRGRKLTRGTNSATNFDKRCSNHSLRDRDKCREENSRRHASSRDPCNFTRGERDLPPTISFFPRARDFPGPRHAFPRTDNSPTLRRRISRVKAIDSIGGTREK